MEAAVLDTAVVVPVLEAEDLVGRWRRRHTPSGRAGMPAHVTLLTPFVAPAELDAGVVLELRSLFAATAPFRLTLARIGRFPGVVYLAPEPAEPFVRLTEAVVARYPAYPPYGGAHETIVPHLTVASTEDEGVLDQAAEAVAAGLPLAAWVEEVWLMEEISKVWERRERFPLRGL